MAALCSPTLLSLVSDLLSRALDIARVLRVLVPGAFCHKILLSSCSCQGQCEGKGVLTSALGLWVAQLDTEAGHQLLGCAAGWAMEGLSKAFPCSAELLRLFQFNFWCDSVDEAMFYRRRAKFPDYFPIFFSPITKLQKVLVQQPGSQHFSEPEMMRRLLNPDDKTCNLGAR